MDLGLDRSGMVCQWQVEIDPFRQEVLAKHWPNVERLGDVKKCGKHNLRAVDLIAGGFPCQDVSNAGKRAGLDGTRSGLWYEFARIICELEPRWVLVENVPGLLSIDNGRGFGTVLRDLAQSGYDAKWDCIPAAAIGAPHRRDRVFVVAYAKSIIGHGNTIDGIWSNAGMGQKGKLGRRDFEVLSPGSSWSLYQPAICRKDDGLSNRVDQLRALGDAVVPQVAEWIGQRILEIEGARNGQEG
jgi:DNA (cytosine-5)-methyltransferase 1